MKNRTRIRVVSLLSLLTIALTGCGDVLVPSQTELDAGEVWVMDYKYMGQVTWKNVSTNPVTASPPPRDTAQPGFNNTAVVGGTTTVAPGDSSLHTLFSFRPPRAGTYTGTAAPLLAAFTLTETVQPVVLKGVGVAIKGQGALSLGGGYLTPAALRDGPLDFGYAFVGSFSTRTININNSANQPMRVRLRLAYGNVRQWIVGQATLGPVITQLNVPANGMTTIIVTFKPTAEEEYWERLEVTDVANANNFAGVVMVGRGVIPREQ